MNDPVVTWAARLARLEAEAHVILAREESTQSRVIVLGATYRSLSALSLAQDDLMRQALRCVENGLFRAAHVMGWAAFMDFLEEKLASDGLVKLRAAYPAWLGRDMSEIRESVPEHQLIDAARKLNLCTKNETNALHGLLRRRNDCAHPSSYLPGINESLGYLSELLQTIQRIQPKSL